MAVQIPWTQAESDLVETMAKAGFSAGQIAARLPDRSRNAVIGRVNRIDGLVLRGKTGGSRPGWKKRVKPSMPRASRPPYDCPVRALMTDTGSRKTRQKAAKPRRKLPPRGDCPEMAGEPMGLSLLDLGSGQCKWPSEGSPYSFCGHAVRADGTLPYCEHHHWVATKPTPGISG